MSGISGSIRGVWPAVVAALIACTSGCTSAISTAYLRDTFWDEADHSAEAEPEGDETVSAATAAASADAAADEQEMDADRRAAAIDEAVARLARLGDLDAAARSTLVETLQRTQQEDWPAVVEAFAASLESTAATQAAAEEIVDRVTTALPASHVVAKADLDGATAAATAAPEPEPESGATSSGPPADLPAVAVATDVRPAAAEAPILPPQPPQPHGAGPAAADAGPRFTVRNSCFATRVRAWGAVDRFTENRFRPGQEVIVYFELDGLSAGESPAGFTTCIDTTLTLVDGAGRSVDEWSFEPIAETCRSKRHDYFARYVVRIPDAARAGDFRVDVAVVDTLAGVTARATLPLEIVATQRPLD
jgi:hypothetical protein